MTAQFVKTAQLTIYVMDSVDREKSNRQRNRR